MGLLGLRGLLVRVLVLGLVVLVILGLEGGSAIWMWTSIVWSNFAVAVFFTRAAASVGSYCFSGSTSFAASM
jgi:hypothetical protein